ncbi:MAG TPA: lytic transglycosylase domain-containing protein [Ruminiclostridium sp.]|nr:lytic transglycosylase domain-containing protein [Ruminiclostridium sp.]
MKRRRRGRKVFFFLAIVFIALAFAWRPAYDTFMKAAYPDKYKNYVTVYSKESEVDPSLVYAVIKSESSFNPNALSNIGAVGLMQVTPPTFEWILDKTKANAHYDSSDLYRPEVNIHYGTAILSELLKEYKDERVALAAYHAGRTNVRKWLSDPEYSKDGKTLYHIPFDDTRAYVNKVESIKKIYADLYYSK